MEQSLNRIWNPLSAELSIQGQREEGSLSNPQGTTLPPAVKLPLLYYSFPDMQVRYQASLSHTARIYCPVNETFHTQCTFGTPKKKTQKIRKYTPTKK